MAGQLNGSSLICHSVIAPHIPSDTDALPRCLGRPSSRNLAQTIARAALTFSRFRIRSIAALAPSSCTQRGGSCG